MTLHANLVFNRTALFYALVVEYELTVFLVLVAELALEFLSNDLLREVSLF